MLNLQGEISGGTFTGELVVNDKEITGGTFSGTTVTNRGTISGGTIDGEIRANTGTIKGCAFGPNVTVTSNEGTIEVVVIVNGEEKFVNYGADIVPEGVDVTDIYVNFRQPGQSEFLYAGMARFPIVLSLSDFDRYWGLKLPSDKAIPMEAY